MKYYQGLFGRSRGERSDPRLLPNSPRSKIYKFLRNIWYLTDKAKHASKVTRIPYMLKYTPFPERVPEGTPKGKGLYLTVYPKLSPNTEII